MFLHSKKALGLSAGICIIYIHMEDEKRVIVVYQVNVLVKVE